MLVPPVLCSLCWLLALCWHASTSAAYGHSFFQSRGKSSSIGPRNASSAPSSFESTLAKDNNRDDLPPDLARRQDVLVALAAVRKACIVTQRLQPTTSSGIATVTKSDLSPVTVADFAAQALVLDHLHKAFPTDSFIAEESSEALKSDKELTQTILDTTGIENVQHVMESIDLGKQYLSWDKKGGRPSRVWCLDPIDGTKGFLRGKRQGGQYAVALALLEDGQPTIGILGCPNLPVTADDDNYAWAETETEDNNKDTRGCIFVASKGDGCFQLPLVPGSRAKRVHVTPNDGSAMGIRDARFCIGVEKGIADALGQCSAVAKILHGEGALHKGEIVKARRIDSQAKYAVLARGGSEYYVRLPKPGYVENIWDHAAAAVVLQEAGGTMTDVRGNPIDFSLGDKLSKDIGGIFGSNGGKFHDALVQAFSQQEKAQDQESS